MVRSDLKGLVYSKRRVEEISEFAGLVSQGGETLESVDFFRFLKTFLM